MFKKVGKIIFACMTLIITCTSIEPAFAYENSCADSNAVLEDSDKTISEYLESIRPQATSTLVVETDDMDYEALWHTFVENELVKLDAEGRIYFTNMYLSTWNNEMTDFAAVIERWNYAIELGLLAVDEETMSFYMPEITDEVIFDISDKYLSEESDTILDTPNGAVIYNPHGCGLPELDIASLCSKNDSTIKTFYSDMCKANIAAGGTLNPWLSTASYWVGLVREGGAWDYKQLSDYKGKTFCSSYGGKTQQHVTAEWLGNYNYGYTGKFLFTLGVLHTGSYVVSGFDAKDEETDWPAIDEGYYDAP